MTFYYAVMRPEWTDLERPGRVAEVWERSQATLSGQGVRPHFEQVARTCDRNDVELIGPDRLYQGS